MTEDRATEERPSDAGGVPAGRTIVLSALSEAQVRELAKALDPRGSALLASPDRFAARERVILVVAGLGALAGAAIASGRFGAPCSPRQEASFALLFALALLPLAIAVVRAIAWTLRARGMPFAPGVYVLERAIVIAHSPALRIVPLAKVAGIGAPRTLLGGRAEITLWIEGEGSETCAVPAARAEAIAEDLEKARARAIEAETSGDPRRRLDVLAEIERSSAWERASTARPRSDLPLSIGAALPVALALGVLALIARNAASDALALAEADGDPEALACYVAGGGASADRVRAEVLPRAAYQQALAAGTGEALGRFVEAYPDAPMTAEARTRWIDVEYAGARGNSWSLRAFLARFPDAPQAAEARAALPRLALEEAIASDAIDAYTYVIREHAGTPEAEQARARRHARYEQALGTLLGRGGRPEALAFFRALFAWLEEHDGPEVLIRFRTPGNAALHRFDAAVAALSEQPVEPLAPQLTERLSVRREALVYDRLRRALEALVPRDVLPIARGAQLPQPLTPEELEQRLAGMTEEEAAAERVRLDAWIEDEGTQPEIRIVYHVAPSGEIYVGSGELDPLDALRGIERAPERGFAGMRFTFDIEMRIPGAGRHALTIGVEPPGAFTVDGGDAAPTGSTVYEAMITEAFDQLGARLEAALLGAPE